MIPKLIHQTWKDANVPQAMKIWSDTWKEQNPEWTYRLWTDDDISQFISMFFPNFEVKFRKYPRQIQRVDAFRYLVLLKYGGLYVDMDFECLEPIEQLLSKETCVIGKEPELHCRRFQKDLILCNAFMASTPYNEFMHEICEELFQSDVSDYVDQIGVLESTGPFFLTNVYERSKLSKRVKIVESAQLYPLTIYETRLFLKTHVVTDDIQRKIDKATAIHYFIGGW